MNILQNRTVITITAMIIIGIMSFAEPSEKGRTVFAADSSNPNISTDSVMTSALLCENRNKSRKSDTVEQIKLFTPTQIISSVYVMSDISDIQKEDTDETKDGHDGTIVKYGSDLNARSGVCEGPSGKETYYNLPMDGVIKIMRNMGYSETEYPYWVRDDGVKMFGEYVMVAANLELRPKGTILECSLGTAMVVDTGEFAQTDETQLDIATSW